jgi:multimeric flavodoxin WrbA
MEDAAMPSVVGISGSPRRGGNSETLLEAALEGARDAGAEVQMARLNELSYVGCQACDACIPAGQCPQQDDLTDVIEKLREADVWLMASPIYFDSVSGQLKACFDRCRCFIRDPAKAERRRAGALIVTYEAGPSDFYADVARHFTGYFDGWFGRFALVEVMSEPRLGPADAASRRPDLLAKAKALGERLVAALA